MTKTCSTCKHFISYAEKYEDPLDDHECGLCRVDTEEEQTSYDYGCKDWEELEQ